MLTCFDVADYFLASMDEESGELISNLKLQKLVYYSQGVHLALYGEPLFGEQIIAWKHGPVVPELYRKYSESGSGPVPCVDGINLDKYDIRAREVLDEVAEVYGQFSAWKLRNMTHEEAPWKDTPLNEEITWQKLEDFFKTQLITNEQR